MGGKGARATRLGPNFPLGGKHENYLHINTRLSLQVGARLYIAYQINQINACLKKLTIL
jgi:hypothetical protein